MADGMSMVNRDLKGVMAASFLGGLVGLPWLFSYSYSLGYDLTLWIYNGWFIKETLLNGVVPNWSYLSASGQPFFKMSGLADGVLVALFMAVFGVFKGVQVLMWALYILAAVGFYKMFFFLRPCRISALTASGAYILSWFITFTANFQSYISNFFIYALLPFFVLCAFRLIKKFSTEVFLLSAAILAVSILANPQVAIKMLVVALLSIVPLLSRDRVLGVFGIAVGVVLLALLLTMFDIVSALRLREEVITANARSNASISPFALIAIPAYALSLFVDFFTGIRWPEISLHELLYSKYPGFVLVLLSIFALRLRDALGNVVPFMWVWVIVSYGVLFLLMPYLPAAPWIGTSHNILIVPTFFIAMLSGLGVSGIMRGKSPSIHNRQLWGGGLACLGLVELGILLWGLRTFAGISISPEKLPQVSLWRGLTSHMEEGSSAPRLFSLSPDHSKNIFPVLTSLATANVIELRQRSPEYQSYLDLIKWCSRDASCSQQIGNLLAPLNVGYVDLPANFFTYRGPVKQPNDYAYYEQGLQKYELDSKLERIRERTVSASDMRPQATSTYWSPWDSTPPLVKASGRIEQVIYKNKYRIPARVCDGIIAIVGNDSVAEKIYEELVLLPEYEPGRFGFLLIASLSELEEKVKRSLHGYISTHSKEEHSSIPLLSIGDVKQLYATEVDLPSVEISSFEMEGEQLNIKLEEPIQTERFIFISQQFFRDWRAVNELGNTLPIFKIGAGLTGAFLESGTQQIELRYDLPMVERLSRWISMLSWGSVGILLTVKYCTRKPVVETT